VAEFPVAGNNNYNLNTANRSALCPPSNSGLAAAATLNSYYC